MELVVNVPKNIPMPMETAVVCRITANKQQLTKN